MQYFSHAMLKLDWQQTKKKETKSWVRRQRKLRLRIYNKKCTRVAYFRSTIFSYSLLAFLFAFGFTFTFTFTLAFDIALRLLGWLVAHALAPVQMNTNKKSVSSYNNKKKGAKVKANVRKLKDWTHDHHTSRQGVRETFQMKVTEMMKVTAVRAQTYCLYLFKNISKQSNYKVSFLSYSLATLTELAEGSRRKIPLNEIAVIFKSEIELHKPAIKYSIAWTERGYCRKIGEYEKKSLNSSAYIYLYNHILTNLECSWF